MRSTPFNFSGPDRQLLSGRLDLPEGTVHAYALFAHCFTCSKKSAAATYVSQALAARGIGVLRFDFTGLGESGGEFAASTFSGSVQDLLAAAAAMDQEDMAPTLFIGHSLGGAAALAAAAVWPKIKAVVTIAAPFDVYHVTRLFGGRLDELMQHGEVNIDLGGRPFRIRREFVDDLKAQRQGERLAALRCAILVLHSPQDETVAVANAALIFEAAHHPKSFVCLDHASHLLTDRVQASYAADLIATWSVPYLRPARTQA